MKKIKIRTKAGVILVAFILIGISALSVMSLTRTITDTSDTIDTYVRNSNGNYWDVTGANIQLAINDLGDATGTVWIGADVTITSELHLNYSYTTLDFEGHRVTLGADVTWLNVSCINGSGRNGVNWCTVRNGVVLSSNGQTEPLLLLYLPWNAGWSERVYHNTFENLVLMNSNGAVRDYHAIKLFMDREDNSLSDKAAFLSNDFVNIYVNAVETVIYFESGNTDLWCNANTFKDFWGEGYITLINFIDRDTPKNGFNNNLFQNMKVQTATYSLWGVRNISGSGNKFDDVFNYDWHVGAGNGVNYCFDILQGALYTEVYTPSLHNNEDDIRDLGNQSTITWEDNSLYEKRVCNATVFTDGTYYFYKLDTGRVRYRYQSFRTLLYNAIGDVNGGKIYIKSGTYILDAQITDNNQMDNVVIEGESKYNTIIKIKDSTTLSTAMFAIIDENNFVFRNLKLDGNDRGGALGKGISITNCENVTLDNLVLYDFSDQSSYAAIQTANSAGDECKNLRITDCDFIEFITAIYLDGGDVDSQLQGTISGNYFTVGTYGIYAPNAFVENMTISDNTFDGVTSRSIWLKIVRNSIITNNHILNGGTYGIDLEDCENNTIMLNTIDATTGIDEDAASAWNNIKDNNVAMSATGISSSGTDTVVGGNIGDTSDNAIYAQLSSSVDQTFAATGAGYNITFNTNDEINGITHSTTVEPQNITIITSGVYSIIAQPQVHAGAGDSGYFHMWLRKDTGSGFADVANTNVEIILASNDEDVIPLIAVISLNAGDIIRVNVSVGDTGIELDAQTPAGEPAIPSIIFSMYRIGS